MCQCALMWSDTKALKGAGGGGGRRGGGEYSSVLTRVITYIIACSVKFTRRA